MIHYDEIFYGNLSGGRLDGYCGITLELGTEREASAEALLATVLAFGRTKIFRVQGDFKHQNKEDLYAVLSTLKENGFITVGVLDGKTKEDWMDELVIRVVNLTNAPWLSFAAQEIHFQPKIGKDLVPPALGELHAQAMCYLDISRDLTATDVFDFLKKYPLWRLYSPPSKTYRMPITMKEEE